MSESNAQVSPAQSQTPAGWYPDGSGAMRWWDGEHWGPMAPTAPPPQQVVYGGRTANQMPVSYTRPQKGHSITVWIILSLFLVFPVIGLIYYSVSPNHYWHF